MDGPAAADHRPGVVLLTDDLRLVSLTPDAEHLLSLLPPGAPLPLPVYAVAAALRSGSALPSARVCGADGSWLTLHASRLTGTGQLAVVVEPAEARAQAIEEAAAEVRRMAREWRDQADGTHSSHHSHLRRTWADAAEKVAEALGALARQDGADETRAHVPQHKRPHHL